MNHDEIQNRVITIVAEIMETSVDQINESSSSDTVETWDSMTQMSLTLALQEEFKVRFVSTQATKLASVKLIIAALEDLLRTK
ncbi:MAG: acyl carrier protein [Proteobacteria bacterium]|nr:MAG: acyl carrier protein [Pseudomonadota bacterium]